MDHVQQVGAATAAVSVLYEAVLSDLDEVGGGIAWWTPQIGWKPSALLGEYLIASCSGLSTSLRDASLAIEQFREQVHADNAWVRSRWATAGLLGVAGGSRLAAIARGPHENRRAMLMGMYRERALASLATALDRLAALTVIIAGAKVDNIIKIDWDGLLSLALTATRNLPQGTTGRFADPGTQGRDRQNRLLGLALTWQHYGPIDWLPWLRRARNTATHRASRMGWLVMLGAKSRPTGLAELFWRQPDWTDTEAMLRATPGSGVEALLLPQDPQAILDGLRESTVGLVTAMVAEGTSLWKDRANEPTLIIQNGGMWPPRSKAVTLNFPGYGPAAPVITGDAVFVHPETSRRLKAAKIMGPDRSAWSE